MRNVTVGAVQMSMTDAVEENVEKAEAMVRQAAGQGANVVLIPELFEGHYFAKEQASEHFARAKPLDGHPTIEHFRQVADELNVVLPLSLFEKANNAHFNSVVIIDADGAVLGRYRKSHIPDGPGYTEKFYFNPGDTGFRVWDTMHGRIGVGICWDQWFPEAARAMSLQGAEILFYPTAIGSEPPDPDWDSSDHWRRVMQGHSGANLVPLVAANRVGVEKGTSTEVTFYGRSFIAGPTGELLADGARGEEDVFCATVDLDQIDAMRRSWGLFRDRRPDLYGPLLTLDGGAS